MKAGPGILLRAVLEVAGDEFVQGLVSVPFTLAGGIEAKGAGAIARIATRELRATHGVSRRAVARLAADIEKNGMKESIKYVVNQGEKFVVDGNHRLRAARKLGLEEVPAQEVTLPYKGYKTPSDLTYTPR